MKDHYDEQFEAVHRERKAQADRRRSEGRYRVLPWHERNRPLYVFALVVSIICHAVTVSASASNVFQFVNSFLASLLIGTLIAVLLTLGFLGSIEWLKRWLVGGFWKDYHDPHNYGMERVYQTGRLLFIIGIFAVDMSLAWHGSWDFVRVLRDAPIYAAPALSDRSEVIALYAPQIANAEQAAQEFKTASSDYSGKMLLADRRRYAKLRKDVTDLTAVRDAALLKLGTDNAVLTTEAKAAFDAQLTEYRASVETQGHWLAWVSLASFAVLVLCMYFLEYYAYRLWFFTTEQKGKTALPHPNGHPLNGQSKPLHVLGN